MFALLKEESPVIYPVRISVRVIARWLGILLMNLPARGGMSLQARPGHPDASLTQLNGGA